MILQKHQVVSRRCWIGDVRIKWWSIKYILITDNKIQVEIPKEDMITQFLGDIVSEAKNETRDLLDRVWFPQIYNARCSSKIESIYPFKHVIYTLYVSPDSAEGALDFISKHKEIEAVTIFADSRFNPDFINALHRLENVHSYYPYLWWFN